MSASIVPNVMPSDWIRPIVDPQAFAAEQARLCYEWSFLGLASDVANDGDWIRASLATRSVFVQRFGDTLKGFENVCPHRFMPLRTSDKGNGHIVCGFHHWRYNKEGLALGIPHCKDLFGKDPRELDVRLTEIDVGVCGNLIFGRFRSPDNDESLDEALGVAKPIVEAMSQMPANPDYFSREVKANWRLCFHTTLDDYHLNAVHPKTFGKIGYLVRDNIGYFRLGSNSAYFTNNDPQAVDKMAAACKDGSFVSANYRIFQIFPNFAILHARADAQFWQILVLQYNPVTHDRCNMRAWLFPAPFKANHTWFNARLRPITDPFRRIITRHVMKGILNEDNTVCEQLQTVAAQVKSPPVLGRLEERVGWFEEVYQRKMSETRRSV